MKNLKMFLLFFFLVVFTACSSGNNKFETNDQAYKESPTEVSQTESSKDNNSLVGEAADYITRPTSNRKIIITYELTFDTTEYDNSIKSINELVKKNQGYHTWISENSYGLKSSNFVVNIPSDNVSTFISDISTIDKLNLKNKNLTSEDITDRYTDLELRLKTQKEKLDRLNELKKTQSTLEELLQLENEITNTITEIERIEEEKNQINSMVDYTEVNISVQEVGLSTTSQTKVSFGSKIAYAISDSLKNFKYAMEELIIWLIYLLPHIVLLLVIILIIRWIFKKFKLTKVDLKNKLTRKNKATNNDDNNKIK